MRYGKIFLADIANGIGARTSLFVSGCTHHCRGCFNPETWDFGYGHVYDFDVERQIVETLEPCIDGLSVLGGEPMEPDNQAALIGLYRRIKLNPELRDKSIWVYSGYTYEELTDKRNKRCRTIYTDEILRLIDVLVDGEFIEEQKDITLMFRGSRNQRVLSLGGNGEILKVRTGSDPVEPHDFP